LEFIVTLRVNGSKKAEQINLKQAHCHNQEPLAVQTPLGLKLDELWSFVKTKKNQQWLWVALERSKRRIVAWVVGGQRFGVQP
jgi:hypothetical protein